ncbi:Cobalamin biosynthesis protein CobD [Hyphomicrobium sp. 1Nfss2.1]|uniref:adenosylcobinamide-phosphate synthase CbiB n=1 Tax=Hyphomicrobium sp. 1Nfss2.1 TaxID=3413936 RepID=UPI003C7BD3C1
MFFFTSLVALLLDAACGYPQWLFARIGHPVTWIGRLIAWCETRWNLPRFSFGRRRVNGTACLIVVMAATAAACVAFEAVTRLVLPWPFSVLVIGAAASMLIAQRSLYEHVTAVAEALEDGGIDAGRKAVGMIVGRDTADLDEAAVSRAAIESLAENYSDGVVAPLFWLIVGGLPGAALYKAVNTADSMIGHKSERYHAFGWAAARLDDLINLPASRLAALLIIAAAGVRAGFDARGGMQAVVQGAGRHRSPNAGWPEAAMAGALDIRLAGPRSYGGAVVEDAWMGSGRSDLGAADIRRALSLFRTACVVQAASVALLGLVTSMLF